MSKTENVVSVDRAAQKAGHCRFLLFSAFPEESKIQKVNIDHAKILVEGKNPRGVYKKEEGDGRTFVKWYILGKFSVLLRRDMHEYKPSHWTTTVESAVFAPTTVALETCRSLQENGYLFFKS
jgi:hypothetical protein